MPLQTIHRPGKIEDVFGNQSIKDGLEGIFSRKKDFPHAFLFSGPTGTGKTTFARIIGTMLKCENVEELNMSNLRGIDSVRALAETCVYAPILGNTRVYILDECFAKGTMVETPTGKKEIQNIIPGDVVFNLSGKEKVKSIFKNKVSLNRVVKVITNKSETICSSDHLFFTDTGWVKAKELTRNSLIFDFSCDSVYDNSYLRKEKIKYDETYLSGMSKRICVQKSKQDRLLQQILCEQKEKSRERNGNHWSKTLRILWKSFHIYGIPQRARKILFPELCWQIPTTASSYSRNEEFFRIQRKTSTRSCQYGAFIKGKIKSSFLRKNEKEQPLTNTGGGKKTNSFSQIERNSSCATSTWGEWLSPQCSGTFIIDFFREFMEKQLCSKNWKKFFRRISTSLQNRYSKSGSYDSNRIRRMESQDSWSKRTGSEKDKASKRIRVDRVEIYEPNCNDESFSSIIGSAEKNQGYVEFYDLEIDGHPSYFANEVLVHNCHRQTRDSQSALLKLLEDPPNHVYFILCTTEPDQLLPTLIGRCHQYATKPLKTMEMMGLLRSITKKEGLDDYPESILKEIVLLSEGLSRNAVVMLDSVIDIEDEDRAIAALSAVTLVSASSKELCQAILKGSSWKDVKKLVKELLAEIEPEKLRQMILGYMIAVLLNKDRDDRLSAVIDTFSEPNFYNAKAGIVNQIYISLTLK